MKKKPEKETKKEEKKEKEKDKTKGDSSKEEEKRGKKDKKKEPEAAETKKEKSVCRHALLSNATHHKPWFKKTDNLFEADHGFTDHFDSPQTD